MCTSTRLPSVTGVAKRLGEVKGQVIFFYFRTKQPVATRYIRKLKTQLHVSLVLVIGDMQRDNDLQTIRAELQLLSLSL